MKYRKKPVEIYAIQYTGDNKQDIKDFCPDYKYNRGEDIMIKTLEGEHICSVGDYVIKGVKGEFYPCKPDIFEMTYDKV